MKSIFLYMIISSLCLFSVHAADAEAAEKKTPIKAVYIPLADHYPGIIAYEKYAGNMEHADYQIQQMKSLPLLRAYFMSGEVDMAYITCPMAMDMFAENPNFRWVSLLHRDGNALAVNELLGNEMALSENRIDRKPDEKVARAFAEAKKQKGTPVECAVSALLSTHTVVLYKYLKDHGGGMNFGVGRDQDVLAIAVAPPKSPAFLKKKNARNLPASFEQSLPWADVVETKGAGKVAWYSKDVMPWPGGHVECIVLATDRAIKEKPDAVREVIYYLHQAGLDIEEARRQGGNEMIEIADMIRKHIPSHSEAAIIQSLRPDLNVINYYNLNVDKAGLEQIMNYAVGGGILNEAIDIEAFADDQFSTAITVVDPKKHTVTPLSGYADTITDNMEKKLRKQGRLLAQWAGEPLVVEAVKKQNAAAMTLEAVKEIDEEWRAGGQQVLAKQLQENKVGLYLRKKVLANSKLYAEAFLCDAQGAIVGEYPKTSDYWQGDEKKFTKSIGGFVYQSPLVLDESTQSFSVQISVPVMDQGISIGVLVVGLRNQR